MDRKSIAGIALAVIGLVCWQIYFTRETQKAARAQELAAAQAAAQAAAAPPPVPNPPAPAPGTPPPDGTPATSPPPPSANATSATALERVAVPEQLQKIATESAEYFF